jgi:hypothetical protein
MRDPKASPTFNARGVGTSAARKADDREWWSSSASRRFARAPRRRPRLFDRPGELKDGRFYVEDEPFCGEDGPKTV